MQKVLIVYNAKSGGGNATKVFVKLKTFMHQSGIDFQEYVTKKLFDTAGIKQAYETCQPTLIISCGGDGTAHDTVNALMPTTVPFLILPAGSGNDFAAMLYGRVKAETLFEKIKHPKTNHADLGICNGRYFLNGIGIGFDGAIARETQKNKNNFLPTKLKYNLAIFKNILKFRSFQCLVTKEGRTISEKAFMIAVANGPFYGGSFKVAPKAGCHDGLLDMIHIGEMATVKRPFYIPVVQRGNHLGLSFVRHEQLAAIHISSINNIPIPAHADGEDITALAYDVEVVVGGLTVLI